MGKGKAVAELNEVSVMAVMRVLVALCGCSSAGIIHAT